ncbi:MAG TPA: hypothetical protein VGZ48_14710 [Candidatus Acidoferrales bacterium]|jgi:hypothetical protein|nr:hypothetical protein [Candidatus Acidoferrales bacterium]
MGEVTHDQANLLLKLYDLRREPRLREARAWFNSQFWANSAEEMMQRYPAGSEANTSMRMVGSYWEMACGLVNRGLIDDDLFFESNGEVWFVFERLRPSLAGIREMYHNPNAYKQIETTVARLEQHWNRTSPGMVELHRQRIAQMREQSAKTARAN